MMPFNQIIHGDCKEVLKTIIVTDPPNGIVLDPFAGSGTTLIAAKKQGFKFIGIDLEKDYVEIAKRRLSLVQDKL